MTQRMIPEDELANWLAEVGYGIEFKLTPEPPVTLEALAQAYMRVHPEDDVTLEDWIWTITQETGALSGNEEQA